MEQLWAAAHRSRMLLAQIWEDPEGDIRQEVEANPSYLVPLRLCLSKETLMRLVFEWEMSEGGGACHCGQLCPLHRGLGR